MEALCRDFIQQAIKTLALGSGVRGHRLYLGVRDSGTSACVIPATCAQFVRMRRRLQAPPGVCVHGALSPDQYFFWITTSQPRFYKTAKSTSVGDMSSDHY
jgi:hypothetical protein